MKIYTIPILKDNYAYVLITNDNTVAVVDPGQAAPIRKFLKDNRLEPDFVLLTHHHGDHTAAAVDFKHEYGAKLVGPKSESDKITELDIGLEGGDTFTLGDETAEIIHTPGHTLGQINFYFTEAKALFSGDTLFVMGCGRVFEGSMEQMYNSMQALRALPDEVLVYCGHEYTIANIAFTQTMAPDIDGLDDYIKAQKDKRADDQPTVPARLGDEKKFNLFLAANDLAVFKQVRGEKDRF